MKKVLLIAFVAMMLSIYSWASETQKPTLEDWQKAQSVYNEFQLMAYLAWEIEEALVPYYEGNFELAKYAFSHVAKVLEFYAGHGVPSSASVDLALVYLRLGKIAEKEKNNESMQDYFAKGTAQYNKASGKNYSTQRLIELIEKIDSDSQDWERQFPTLGEALAPNHILESDGIHGGDSR